MSNLPNSTFPAPPIISTFSPEALGPQLLLNGISGVPGSNSLWPTANKAIFIPFVLRFPITVVRLWTNNATAVTDTRDIGIYSEDGTKIVSTGSTAGSGTSTLQVYSVTATTIGPGRFYLALANSGSASRFFATGVSAVRAKTLGVYEMTSAFPLPATATFATISSAYQPMIGLATTTLV